MVYEGYMQMKKNFKSPYYCPDDGDYNLVNDSSHKKDLESKVVELKQIDNTGKGDVEVSSGLLEQPSEQKAHC